MSDDAAPAAEKSCWEDEAEAGGGDKDDGSDCDAEAFVGDEDGKPEDADESVMSAGEWGDPANFTCLFDRGAALFAPCADDAEDANCGDGAAFCFRRTLHESLQSGMTLHLNCTGGVAPEGAPRRFNSKGTAFLASVRP